MFERATNIEEILSSLDGIKRAEAPPFLYTRIQERLTSQRKSIFENLNILTSKPVRAITFLLLILLLDGLALQSTLSMPGKSEDSAENSFVDESGITAEEFLGTTDFEEILIYEVPYTDYASGY